MLLVVEGRLNPELVAAIAEFRGEVYARDGVRINTFEDTRSWHIAIVRHGQLDGCVRYTRRPAAMGNALIGGWAVRESRRHTRDAVKLALRCVQLAEELGDPGGIASATTRHGSAQILERLGGRVLARYYDAEYGSEMVSIEFKLSEMLRHRIPKAA